MLDFVNELCLSWLGAILQLLEVFSPCKESLCISIPRTKVIVDTASPAHVNFKLAGFIWILTDLFDLPMPINVAVEVIDFRHAKGTFHPHTAFPNKILNIDTARSNCSQPTLTELAGLI